MIPYYLPKLMCYFEFPQQGMGVSVASHLCQKYCPSSSLESFRWVRSSISLKFSFASSWWLLMWIVLCDYWPLLWSVCQTFCPFKIFLLFKSLLCVLDKGFVYFSGYQPFVDIVSIFFSQSVAFLMRFKEIEQILI